MLNVYPIRLRFISARLLASVASIFKSAGCKGISFVAAKKLILNVSEPPRMSVVPRRSDVFASQKLASRSVHGCTLLDRLFQKAYGEYVLRYAATANSPRRIRSGTDAAGSKPNRVRIANSQLKNVQEVHSLACLRYFFALFLVSTPFISKGLRKGFFQNGQGCP